MCFQSSGKLWERLWLPPSLDTKIVQCHLACWRPSEMGWDTGSLRKPKPAVSTPRAASFPTTPCVQDSICLYPAALLPPPWFPSVSALEELFLRVWATAGGFSAEQQQSLLPQNGIPGFPILQPGLLPRTLSRGLEGLSSPWAAINKCELLSQLLLILYPDTPFNPELCSECTPC